MTSPDKPRLQGTFETRSDGRIDQHYGADTDTGEILITGLRALLEGSATAQRLIQMADEQGLSVQFIRGPQETVHVPETRTIFMSLTPSSRPNPRLALLYAGGLREVEQNLLGYGRPGADVKDDNEWAGTHLAKNIDIILNLCHIVRELSERTPGKPDFLDSLRALGHSEIYEGFVNGLPFEDLVKLEGQKELS